jgi:hypothetical protein
MRRLLVGVVAGVFLVCAGVATATAQPTKSVTGTVSAVGPDSITVKVKDQDMKFSVDQTTDVLARGGTTATRAAKAEGKSGPAIAAVVKPGQTVEVKYHEAGMHATNIHVVPSAAPAATATSGQKEKEKPKAPAKEKSKSMTAAGTVTSMTGTSLTLKTGSGEQTFNVDANVKVVGTGLGTKGKEATAAGKKMVLSDAVAVGDSVSVTYHEAGGAKEATAVRVRTKAKK